MGVVRGAGWLTAIAGVLLAMLALTNGAQAQYLSLPGSLSVSPNGAATYSIPIQVPPGTAGMVPSLSLDYNSQGGNGIVGHNWSLGGLPQITRCPRTKAQDGYFRGVYYDTGDAYCLDGQRLILTAGAPGAHGAEYRTEIDGFSRITAHNVGAYAPLFFLVQTKAGQTMYFGATEDSRLYSGTGAVVSWHVNQILDASNNTIHIGYYGEPTPGAPRYRVPTWIAYGGNQGAQGSTGDYAVVRFKYAETPPKYIGSRYANGVEFSSVPHLLKEIVTYVKVNGQNKLDPNGSELEVDSYRLHYLEDDVLWTNKLHAVVHCRPSGQGLPMTGGLTAAEGGQPCIRTDFDWSTGSDTVGGIWMPDQDIGGGGNISADRYSLIAGDFNADGFTDLLRAGNDNGGPNDTDSLLYLARSTDGANIEQGEFFYSGALLSGYNAKDHTILPGGWLGRAKPTILTVENDKYGGSGYEYHRLQFFEYGGGAFSPIGGEFTLNKQPFHSSGNVLDYESWGSGDFNGDGLQDLTHWEVEHGTHSKDYRFQVWLNRASATGEPTGFVSFSQADFTVQQVNVQSKGDWPVTPVVGDFNGDGKDDLIVNFLDKTHTGLHIYRSDGTSFAALDNDYGEIGNAIYTGDFNGDGLPDLMGVNISPAVPPSNCAALVSCAVIGHAYAPNYSDPLTYDKATFWINKGARPGQDIEFVEQPYHYVIGGRATTQPRADGSLKAPDWDIVIGDFNGTGRTGFALIPTCERDTSCNHNAEFYASVGVGFRQVPPLTRAAYSGYAIIMGDWTGVGTTGFLRQPKKGGSQYPGPSNVVKHNWTKPARSEIVKITTALGEETMIESKPLTDDTVYGTFGNYDYPEVRITAPIYVVSAVEASTAGVTPTYYRSEYFYENAVVDQTGRGFLGFRKKKSTDVQSGISQTTTYAQGFPFTGMVTKVEKHLNDTILLSETTNTLESLPAVPVVGYPVFPYVSQTVADSWDLETDVAHLNGTGTLIPMPRTVTTYQYDWYGNATRVATSVPGGTRSITLNDYTNDIGPNWHLGRLWRSKVITSDLSE